MRWWMTTCHLRANGYGGMTATDFFLMLWHGVTCNHPDCRYFILPFRAEISNKPRPFRRSSSAFRYTRQDLEPYHNALWRPHVPHPLGASTLTVKPLFDRGTSPFRPLPFNINIWHRQLTFIGFLINVLNSHVFLSNCFRPTHPCRKG